MGEVKRVRAKQIGKHELEKDWELSNYIPEVGEAVYYDPEIDENGNPDIFKAVEGRTPITHTRQKNGDGTHRVADLPFVQLGHEYINPNLVASIQKRIEQLESLSITYIEDNTVAYEKVVPANVGKYALIKSVGGASKASDNICDPRTLTSNEEITVNADNSITFDVAANGMTAINLPTLPKGTYYWVVETNTNITVNPYTSEGVATNNPFEITSDTDNFYFEFENIDWSGGETTAVTVTAKIAVFKGSIERGYVPFFSGFKNAEVSEIKSIGANRFNQTLLNEYSDYFSVDEIGVTLKKSDGRAWANIPISYTLEAGDYTIHIEKSDTCRIQVYSVEAEMVIKETSKGIATFTLSKKTSVKIKILAVSGTSYPAFIGNVMFSNGTTAVPYKPYRSEPIDTFTIPESVKSFADYGKGIDAIYNNSISFDNGKIIYKKYPFIELTLNGSENWQIIEASGVEQSTYFVLRLGDYGSIISNVFINDTYPNTTISSANTNIGMYITNSSGYNEARILIRPADYETLTLEEFKARLAANPVRVMYVSSEEPEIEDITHLFTEYNEIEVENGGILRFISNQENTVVPSEIMYATRRG